jgi:hypothetical protein
LTALTVGPDDGGRLGWRAEAKAADLGKELGGAQRALGPDRVLDDGKQLALQRSMMALRPPPKALDDLVRRVLDREIDRHWFRARSDSEPW